MAGNKEVYEKVTAQILDQLNKGIIPWIRPFGTPFDIPRNAITRRRYSGINVFALWSAAIDGNFKSSGWLTFQQAKKASLWLNKGSKGTAVIFMKKIERKDSDTGEVKKIFLARLFTVFNLDQFKDSDEKTKIESRLEKSKTVYNGSETIAELESIVSKTGAEIVTGIRACYIPSLDRIEMPAKSNFIDTPRYYATMFHELAHWTGHKSRLNRVANTKFGCSEYALEELVAELSAAYLSMRNGIDVVSQSTAYLQLWIKALENDASNIVTAASAAQKAADYIMPEEMASEDNESETLEMAAA